MRYNVLVVGAGPAGSLTAALFAKQGRRVLLVDGARFPRSKACAEVISPGGVEILRRRGVLRELSTGRRLAGMLLRSPGGVQHTLRYGPRSEQSALCLPRAELDHALLRFAHSQGAEVREQTRIRRVIIDRGRVRGVIGPHDERLEAELTVGADGLHSLLARTLGLTRPRRWPKRLGLTAHFAGVEWTEDTGQMHISSHGYVGAAPLDGRGLLSLGLVRSLPRRRLGSPLLALDATLRELYPDLHARVARGCLAGQVTGAGPLGTRVHRVNGPGYALVGDAAGFFDPFTGEGIFRALRGAELLADHPHTYAARRRQVFGAKERLVALVQAVIQTPRLCDFAMRRLNERPAIAVKLGGMLADLLQARLSIVWQLLGA
jgi:flavin-dependent dehydrogenase